MSNLFTILDDLDIKMPKMIRKDLPTGIHTRFYPGGGEVKVTTDGDKNFAPYLRTFLPLKDYNELKRLEDD